VLLFTMAEDTTHNTAKSVPTSTKDDSQNENGQTKSRKRKRKGWKKVVNTFVYVENLPLDITMEEIVPHFQKCGILKKDPYTGELKVKLYTDSEGRLKGDASVGYFKKESVDLAEMILDGSQIRPGHVIKVTRAKFTPKKDYDEQKKPRRKGKPRINQAEELGWEDWDTRRHIILEGMFSLDEVDSPEFYTELKAEIKEEVQKIGDVELVTVFERNPKGVVAVKFKQCEDAAKCLEEFNGRWFAKRQIKASWYDGVTDYYVKPPEGEEDKRLENFGSWLDEQSDPSSESEPEALEED